MCNSSHSRILGFLTTLPGIWRALQCIRRYWDTGNKFPHLLNCGKYIATILFYASLSIYRIDQKSSTKAVFILFATINGVYTSFWDIYYDWSLGDPRAKHRFLRKELAYKKVWWYYGAMIVDPILRFNWVLYLIIPLQLQHSAVTGFCAAVGEVCRRGMWSIFRVENEHCTNVGRFRASRDVPLPYYVPDSPEPEEHTPTRQRVDEEQPRTPTLADTHAAAATGAQLDRSASSIRQRRSLQDEHKPSPLQRAITQVGDILRVAHAQDFERKRKPELGRDPRETKDEDSEEEEESEEEQEEDDDEGSGSDGNADAEADEEVESHDSEQEMEDDEQESALSRIREDLAVGMSGARGDRATVERDE